MPQFGLKLINESVYTSALAICLCKRVSNLPNRKGCIAIQQTLITLTSKNRYILIISDVFMQNTSFNHLYRGLIYMKELLVLGSEGSGKSLLIRRIKEVAEGKFNQDIANEYTIPTTGVEIINVELSSEVSFNVREIGSAISSRWENYLADCSGLVFTIDVSDIGSLSSAMVLLHHEILNSRVIMSKRPILLAFSKTDCAPDNAVNVAENFLRLSDLLLQWPNIKRVSGSCIDKSLAGNVLAWIESEKVIARST